MAAKMLKMHKRNTWNFDTLNRLGLYPVDLVDPTNLSCSFL
jgi:hypothetical protein